LQVLAAIDDYDALHAALRARAVALRLSRATIDDLSGVPDRYCAKLFGPGQVRRLGQISLGPVLSALGVKLILVDDPEARRAIERRAPKRDETQVRRARRSPLWVWARG
jgi:hypothetical protein